ncbi:MAG: hypothetical protein R3B49_08880 [Phycisphaerales bacterium]
MANSVLAESFAVEHAEDGVEGAVGSASAGVGSGAEPIIADADGAAMLVVVEGGGEGG